MESLPGARPRGPRAVAGLLLTVALVGLFLAPSAVGAPAGSFGATEVRDPAPLAEAPSAGAHAPAAPRAVSFPWWGGLSYQGPNTTGAIAFVANLTIPLADPDGIGFNYTASIGASDSVCTYGQAAIQDDQGAWKFTGSMQPYAGATPPPLIQGWPQAGAHLVPGDTYQLGLVTQAGSFAAVLYNVTNGEGYTQGTHVPDASVAFSDANKGLRAGPTDCGPTNPVSLTANLSVVAATGPSGGSPTRDLFFQDEAVSAGSAPFQMEAIPNLWDPYFHGSPSGFAPAQAWSTSALIVIATDHPAITLAATTQPRLNVDEGQQVSVGLVGTPRVVPGADNTNTYAFTQAEFAGYLGSDALSFATCSSKNASTSNPGYPGGDSGIPAEYGYASNTTPTLSDIHPVYIGGGVGFPLATNTSIDLRCFTGPLATPGYLDIYGVSYLQYDVPTGVPSAPLVAANVSGPRDLLGMNGMFWNVTIHPLPTVNISVPSTYVVVGSNAVFTATEYGGTPGYAYTWYVDGTAQGSCSGTSCTLSWGAPAPHHVWVAVTDAEGSRGVSSHLNISVINPVSASISPFPTATASLGSATIFTAHLSGGTSGYTYEFFSNFSVAPLQSGPSGTFSYTPFHGGTYQVWVTGNDSNGDWGVSAHSNLTVYVGVVVNLSPLTAAQEPATSPALFTAAASGGTGAGYTYQWLTSPGLTPIGSCTTTCSFSSGGSFGTYQVWSVATDSGGLVGVSAHANLSVVANPAFSSWTAPGAADEGANVTFSATFTGGDPAFTYAWTLGEEALGYCSNAPHCSILLGYAGLTSVGVNLTDALGTKAAAPRTALTVDLPLSVTLTPSGTLQAEVANPSPLAATASAGTGGNTYGFLTSLAPSTPFGVGPTSSVSWTPASAESLQIWAEANDSSGFRAVSPHLNVTVFPKVSFALNPSPTASISAGGTLNVSVVGSGGVSPYTFSWFVDGAVQPACGAAAYCLLTWSSAAVHQVWVNGTDALGVSASSPATTVSVTSGATVPVEFVAAPSLLGKLVINDSATPSGTTSYLRTGSYPIQAVPQPGDYFRGWNVSNASGLSVLAPTSETTTLTVVGAGTVMAEFNGSATFSITVGVSPATGGSVDVNGTPEPNGQVLTLAAGDYPLDGTPGAGYKFSTWRTSGGASVTLNEPASLLEVAGASGSITLVVTPKAGPWDGLYNVSLAVSPSGAGGTFTLGSIAYLPGAVVPEKAGTYALSFELPSGYTFSTWSTSGGLSIAGPSSATTTLNVSGNGTITAVLTASSGSSPLSVSVETEEILLGLVAVLLVLVVVGYLRHRSHQRLHPAVPVQGSESATMASASSMPAGPHEAADAAAPAEEDT